MSDDPPVTQPTHASQSLRLPIAFWALLALTAACFGLVCFGYNIYRLGWERRVLRLVRPHGVRLKFPAKEVVKDHGPGPQQFGGWMAIPIGDGLKAEKTLIPASPPSEAAAVKLKVPIVVEEPSVVEIRGTGGLRQAFSLHPGAAAGGGPIQWVELELAPENYVYTNEGGLLLSVELKQVSGRRAGVIIDSQRSYGRTALDRPLDGELVMAVELYR